MSSVNYSTPKTLAIGLGANIASPSGTPRSTLISARPIIEKNINNWINAFLNEKAEEKSLLNSKFIFHWSPLYKSKALGGPENQPNYINAVLLVKGGNLSKIIPSIVAASNLLQRLHKIEKEFGRERKLKNNKWGPRSLDIDLLAWGDLQVKNSELILPHPYLLERNFVLIPLAEAMKTSSEMPIQIANQEDWKE